MLVSKNLIIKLIKEEIQKIKLEQKLKIAIKNILSEIGLESNEGEDLDLERENKPEDESNEGEDLDLERENKPEDEMEEDKNDYGNKKFQDKPAPNFKYKYKGKG